MKKQIVAPKEGEGLHQWLLGMSRALLLDGLSRGNVVKALMLAVKDSDRTTQDVETEIENAVDGAFEFLEANPGMTGRRKGSVWTDPLGYMGLDDSMVRKDRRSFRVPIDQKLVDAVYRKTALSLSLVRDGNFTFYQLFAGIDHYIAVCQEMHSPVIQRCSGIMPDLNCMNYQYIVPNPMWKSSKEGGTRSDFNTDVRYFVVVEFDAYPHIYQCAAFDYLHRKGKLPLVMIVDSGGKSMHGWFACFGVSEHKVKTFCRLATSIGADKTTASPSQWVRMPNGWNQKHGKSQHVVWFSARNLRIQNASIREDLLDED